MNTITAQKRWRNAIVIQKLKLLSGVAMNKYNGKEKLRLGDFFQAA